MHGVKRTRYFNGVKVTSHRLAKPKTVPCGSCGQPVRNHGPRPAVPNGGVRTPARDAGRQADAGCGSEVPVSRPG